MLRNLAGQSVGAQMTDRVSGTPFVGTVTVFITIDGGVQTQGSVGGGVCVHEGKGYYSYSPAASETDGTWIAYTFEGIGGSGAITTTVQVMPITLAQSLAVGTASSGGQAFSATDLCTRALRLLGVVAATDTPQAEDLQTAYLALNDLIDTWATQRQTVYHLLRSVFPLTAGVATYTLGLGGTWNIIRPVWIENCSVIPNNSGSGNTGPMEIPLGPPLDSHEFQRITIKTALSAYPQYVYWDHSWVNGLSTVQVYPVPTTDTCAIVLYTPQALTQFPDRHSLHVFPPGYARAMRYNLAVELAPEYGLSPAEAIREAARQSLADIKRANHAPVEAQFDAALVGIRGRYNIYTDSY